MGVYYCFKQHENNRSKVEECLVGSITFFFISNDEENAFFSFLYMQSGYVIIFCSLPLQRVFMIVEYKNTLDQSKKKTRFVDHFQ